MKLFLNGKGLTRLGTRSMGLWLSLTVLSVPLVLAQNKSDDVLNLTTVAPEAALEAAPEAVPEAASGLKQKKGWVAKKFMVAAANPLAVKAGYQILKEGGSAVDAAIAIQMVLTLVEPQSSGIGGGAFMLHFDGKQTLAFDGRETAPASATEALFQDASGKALSRVAGIVGGRSVGVPGVLRMLEMAHRQYGKLPWARLFEPAIQLAENGFLVSPRLNSLLASEPYLRQDQQAARYFFSADGKPRPVNYLLKNPALAKTLREIAAGGATVFYTGHIARDIEAKVTSHPSNPGGLTVKDMAAYQAKQRTPICTDYREVSICGMPPPSSGGIAIAQMLGMLETLDMAALAPKNGQPNMQAVHWMSEAGRLAYADRNRYVADTDFVPLPGKGWASLLDKTYLQQRASLMGEKSMGRAKFGIPPGMDVAWGSDTAPEYPSTSHLSVVDAQGRAVSMTTTIEDAFGSRQMVNGFLLNNQLTDFSFDSVDANGPIANRVEPGKRPRSSMAPTLVFAKNSKTLLMTLGSPGGTAIINYVCKVLLGVQDWGLNLQQAIDLPNFGSRNGPTELEQGRFSEADMESLKNRGHKLWVSEQTSGVHGIMRMQTNGVSYWFGAADPRREGVAQGD